MGKATELFLESFAKQSFQVASQNKRRMIKYEDVAEARIADDRLEFLDGVVPPP